MRLIVLIVLAVIWGALLLIGSVLLTDYKNGIGAFFMIAGWLVMWVWFGLFMPQ